MALRSSFPDARRPERPLPEADLEAVRGDIALAAAGSAGAFGALYDRYHREILRYFRTRLPEPEVARELTQQLFLRAWQAVPRYREGRISFASWLLRMAHSLAVDHARASRKAAPSEGLEIGAGQSGVVQGLIAGERSARVQRALERLSEDHRQMLILRLVLETSAREIGEVMGRSEASARGLQVRALESLRDQLEAEGERR